MAFPSNNHDRPKNSCCSNKPTRRCKANFSSRLRLAPCLAGCKQARRSVSTLLWHHPPMGKRPADSAGGGMREPTARRGCCLGNSPSAPGRQGCPPCGATAG